MSELGIVIPAYRMECPYRRTALLHVLSHIAGLTRMTLFSRRLGVGETQAKARNRGARDSSPWGDVLFFNDADSIVSHESMVKAADLARRSGRLVFAYTTYSRLSRRASDLVHTGEIDPFDAPVEWERWHSLSAGSIAIRRDLFEQVGGFDERYRQGFEDLDFARRCREELGPEKRIDGELVHLWHPRPEVEPEDVTEDRERYLERWGVTV